MNPARLRQYFAMILVACAASLLAFSLLRVVELERRSAARELAQSFALKLVERVNEAGASVYMLTAAVDRRTGEVARFEEIADEILANFPLVRTLELAPGGVIWHVHPLRGNEAVVGHDLLVDKTRNREVHLAISRRQMAIAGPLILRQGGVGVLARYPLYTIGVDGRSRFWGLSIAVIDFPSLLLVAGEGEFARLGYRYEICWKPYGSEQCNNLKGEPVVASEAEEHMAVGLSQAEWRLMVSRHEGWLSGFETAMAFLFVGISTLLAWRFSGKPVDRQSDASDSQGA